MQCESDADQGRAREKTYAAAKTQSLDASKVAGEGHRGSHRAARLELHVVDERRSWPSTRIDERRFHTGQHGLAACRHPHALQRTELFARDVE
jgi:hypothetical protein